MLKNNHKTVAIIGRPNVGKSTLFNRLVGRRIAIETPVPGTTRDRLFGEVEWSGQTFTIIDAAGIEFGKKTDLEKNIQIGVELAMEMADLLIFLVDWNDKDNQTDQLIAKKLRQNHKNVILAVNKSDNIERIENCKEFQRLGNFDNVSVSAISGRGSGDLCDLILKKLLNVKRKSNPVNDSSVKLAIIGRPNTGKSTLINTIAGEDVSVVSSQAGTTRDMVNYKFEYKKQLIELIDTAGLRRRGKIKKDTIESYSILRSYKALRECDIAIMLIDGSEGLVSGEATIISQAAQWGKGLILAINKIDLWSEDKREDLIAKSLSILQTKLNFTPWLPAVFISAEKVINIDSLLNQTLKVSKDLDFIIPAKELTQILEFAKGKNSQIQSLVEIKTLSTKPLKIELVYKNRIPHQSQVRYMENQIRDHYPLNGVPMLFKLVSTKKR